MTSVKGHCDPAFSKVKDLLESNLKSGEDLGAAICINVNGKNIVDIWGGYSDNDGTKEWQEDTIVDVFSSSKTVSNLAVLVLAARGQVDVNEKVSTYWPEFAQNGKDDVRVRHLLSHSSGVSGWEAPMTMEDVCNLEYSTAKSAKQAPWWEPGTASGYHAMNQGHLVGEVVRRVTGKSLKKFIAEEIAGPLGADFQLGALEKDWPRISTLLPPPPLLEETGGSTDKNSIPYKTLTAPVPDALFALSPAWRNAEVGAANGHANARALVRTLSVVTLGGEVDGVRLLKPETIDLIFQEQTNGMDLVLNKPIRFGIGFGLPNETVPHIPDGRKCFWGGWGGSSILMDLDNKMTFSYVMNKMGSGTLGSPRTKEYISTAYDCLGKMKP